MATGTQKIHGYTGGTDGLRDGSVRSEGDHTAPVIMPNTDGFQSVFPSTPVKVYIRTDQVTPPMMTGQTIHVACGTAIGEVSVDGSTWGATATGAVATDVNGAFYWKRQVAGAPGWPTQFFAPDTITFGSLVEQPVPPVFGTITVNLSSTAVNVTFAATDVNTGDSVTVKGCVYAVGSTPDIADATTITSPKQFTTLVGGASLVADTDYLLAMWATDSTGLVTARAAQTVHTTAASNNPPTISALSATATTHSITPSATVSDPEGNAIVIQKIIVKQSTSTPTQADWDAAPTFVSGAAIDSLLQATTYHWWILAGDSTHQTLAAGASVSSMQTQATATVGNVAGFTATAGDAQVVLAWTAAAGETFEVDRATDAGFTANVSLNINAGAGATGYTDTGRTNNTTYYYRVKKRDSANNYCASYATANAMPIAWVAQWSDNFNRTNGALGANWTAMTPNGGTLLIASNQAQASPGADAAKANSAVYAANQKVQARFVTHDGDWQAQVGLCLCMTGTTLAGLTGYMLQVYVDSLGLQIVRWTNGTAEVLTLNLVAGGTGPSFTAAAVDGHTLALVKEGTRLSMQVDGVEKAYVTDANHSSGQAGIKTNIAADHYIVIDDFATFTK